MGGAGKIFESFLDIIIFLYVSSAMSVYLYLYFDTTMSDKIKESMSGDISAYLVEYGEVLDWHEVVQMLLVVANLLVFFRILMFSALLDAVHEIVKTILKALSSMTTFFLLVFVCFSLSLSSCFLRHLFCTQRLHQPRIIHQSRIIHQPSNGSTTNSHSIHSTKTRNRYSYSSHHTPECTFLEATAWISKLSTKRSRHNGNKSEETRVSCQLFENFPYSHRCL